MFRKTSHKFRQVRTAFLTVQARREVMVVVGVGGEWVVRCVRSSPPPHTPQRSAFLAFLLFLDSDLQVLYLPYFLFYILYKLNLN